MRDHDPSAAAPCTAMTSPGAPTVPPASDADPIRSLEREFATYLNVAPEQVIACGDTGEAYRALIEAGRAAVDRTEGGADDVDAVVPALLGGPAARAAHQLRMPVAPADVDAVTGALAPRGLVRALRERPAMAVAVHAFGHPAPVDELARLVDGRRVSIVEDASDAIGAALRGVPPGRMAEAAIVAFRWDRLLTGGAAPDAPAPGALLVQRDANLSVRTRERCTPLAEHAASVALAELRQIDEELQARRELAWELTLQLRGARALGAMPHAAWIRHAYPRYVVRLRRLLWQRDLEETLALLRAEGVPCEPAAGPALHRDPEFRGLLADDRAAEDHLHAAEALAGELIAIPLHSALTARDMTDLARILRHLEERST